MTPEQRLVAAAVELQHAALDVALEDKAVHLLLDAVSLARLADSHPVVAAVRTVATGRGACSDWASAAPLTPADAALVNGTATHAHFHDDTDMSAWAHPASLVIPAVVAAAQGEGNDDVERVLRGLVAGYAALSWLAAREEVSRSLVERSHRAGPALGAIAAAVGAATTLWLDERQTADAIAIATDSTGALLEPVGQGAQDWRLQNGFAAQRGLVAALLARQGVRGPARPLTGTKGLLSTLQASIPAQWEESPDPAAVLDVWFKPFPTLGDNMAPAVAAASLHGQVEPDAVRSIRIEMNAHFAAYPGTAYRGPFERTEQAIASTAFAVSALVARGDLSYADYDALMVDPRVLRLVETVTIEPREDLGYLDGVVRLTTETGEVSATAAEQPRTLFFRDAATTMATLRRRGQQDLAALVPSLLDPGARPGLGSLVPHRTPSEPGQSQ